MAVTMFEGIIKDGQNRLLGNVPLPEQAKAYVLVPSLEPASRAHTQSPRLAHPEQATNVAREVVKETDAG